MVKKMMAVSLVVFAAAFGGCGKKSDSQAASQPKKASGDASRVYDQLPDSAPRLK